MNIEYFLWSQKMWYYTITSNQTIETLTSTIAMHLSIQIENMKTIYQDLNRKYFHSTIFWILDYLNC
jgi:hypothetical protein